MKTTTIIVILVVLAILAVVAYLYFDAQATSKAKTENKTETLAGQAANLLNLFFNPIKK